MFLKYLSTFIIVFIAFTHARGQNIEYEYLGNQILTGSVPNEVYICEGVIHNNSQDTIQIELNRIEFESDESQIFTAICTDYICYTVRTDNIIEFIPPGRNYKCEMRWLADPLLQGLEMGSGNTKWKIKDLSNSIIIDTIQSEFHYSILASNTDFDNKGINIYPNPVSDYLNFENLPMGSSIQIFSSQGKLVLLENPSNSKIDVEFLDQGTYFGKIIGEGFEREFKFIK